MTDVFAKASVSSELAHRIIAAAEAKASEIGVPMVIAVCDESGVLKALSRMDGAALLSVQVAQDKAYTAVGFGMPTEGWHDFIKDDPPLAAGAVGGIDRLVIFGGGYPIKLGDTIIGGIGVSGGHYSQDMEVAQAGLAVLGGASYPTLMLYRPPRGKTYATRAAPWRITRTRAPRTRTCARTELGTKRTVARTRSPRRTVWDVAFKVK